MYTEVTFCKGFVAVFCAIWVAPYKSGHIDPHILALGPDLRSSVFAIPIILTSIA